MAQADTSQDTTAQDDSAVVQSFVDKTPGAMPKPSSGGIDDLTRQADDTLKAMPSVNEQIDYDKRSTQAKADAMQKGIDVQKRGVQMLDRMQAPTPPKAQQMPKPPQEQMRSMFQAFQNPAVVLAGLASLATRAPLTAAFKAGAAALEGFHKGDQEAIKQNVDNWRNETDRAINQSREDNERYRNAWEKYRDDKTKLIAELQAAASISKDEVVLAELKQGANPERITGLYQERLKATTDLAKAKAQIQMYLGKSMTMLTPEATQEMGEILAKTGTIPGGLSRFGQMDRAAIFNAATQASSGAEDRIANSLDYRAQGAASTAVGRREGGVTGAISTAEMTAPRVLETSKNVDRTQFPKLNDVILAAKQGTGDENVIRFGIAVNTFINNYARALGAGNANVTDSARREAQELLSRAYSQGQTEAAVDQMMTELKSELAGAKKGIERVTGKKSTAPEAVPDRPSSVPDGSAYSPSRKMWRSPDGKLFDASGKPTASLDTGERLTMSDEQPDPVRDGQQYAQNYSFQIQPRSNGQYAVINVSTGQVVYVGSMDGARNAQASAIRYDIRR